MLLKMADAEQVRIHVANESRASQPMVRAFARARRSPNLKTWHAASLRKVLVRFATFYRIRFSVGTFFWNDVPDFDLNSKGVSVGGSRVNLY